MQNSDGTPTTETPAEGAPQEEGSVADSLPTLPTQAEIEAAFSEEEPGSAGQEGEVEGETSTGESQESVEGEPAVTPENDPDGDAAFQNEFKDFKMPDGLKNRITKLTEQRNTERELTKSYEFFKPYASDQGKQYLHTLVQFDQKLEQAAAQNPWLADFLKDVVLEGKQPDLTQLSQALGNEVAEVGGGAEGEAGAAPMDPRDKTLKELKAWKEKFEADQQQTAQAEQHRQLVDQEKEGYRKEISDFEQANPEFKGDKQFLRLALQNSAARNITFTAAAKELSEYMGGRKSAQLKELAKVDSERAGAAVETPGRGGVPSKSRPAFGSDEERAQMLEQLGIADD